MFVVEKNGEETFVCIKSMEFMCTSTQCAYELQRIG